ncbi:protein CEPU-1 isoform X1 [Lingula anatina]|uniref:Protein CEPU-1 isoform X1 n=1 Tax=Lingula anatina TaxID=7574 RepID=A0A1S3H4U6_LINAN|nr:protein CEPU-1 isoform X1 [Lingula anatina]|eukprot:XP_013380992.1 protein CEPU-1 isoform X1 [Lingula anatina]
MADQRILNQDLCKKCVLLLHVVVILVTQLSLTTTVTITGVSNNPGSGRRYLLAGDTLDLECWSRRENDFTLEWLHDNEVIRVGQENPSVLSTQGYPATHPKGRTKLQLEWRNVDLNQTGSYSCKDIYEDMFIRKVTVIDIKPEVMKVGSPIPDGTVALKIRCNVYGIPNWAYAMLRWFKDGREISSSDEKGKLEMSGNENYITIYDPSSSDKGNYMCSLSTLGNVIELFNRTVYVGSEYVGNGNQICTHWILVSAIAVVVLLL